ncbi:M48 family metallopeptidase [Anatilimnocola floriformis]|uniref:M48 family metallopeptidase n=1 Tax=Anatilimnocola floriformis TaxID=2948575 RepID=UPI0020C4F2E4|nr:M48 family metallopeptidase [Anatilimnocola floriformis]
MPITVICEDCSHQLVVGDQMAGKQGLCPNCKTVLTVPAQIDAAAQKAIGHSVATAGAHTAVRSVPVTTVTKHQSAVAPAAPAAAANDALQGPALRAAVMNGFRGSFPPVPTAHNYKLGMFLTASFMVLLPLVYLLVIFAVGGGVLWHLSNNHVMLHGVRGRGAMIVFAIYIAPAIIGAIIVAFMFKPFFAWPGRQGRTRSVTQQSDPLLFEFVEKICELVGSPRPRRIDVDCDINASASFRNGWLSLLGDDMVLRIGMPLAAGLSLQQFAGVLAHEFGHFSQGFGMRLTYVVRSINGWFTRVVFERDAWDEWLQEAAPSLDLRISWILYLAMAGIWLSRRILWCLMYSGHLVAGYMLRQMEFDADRYEARLAGSETFGATCRQLRLLQFAWQGAQADLNTYSREGRLADNLPRLLMANLKQLPPEAKQAVEEIIAKEKGSLFDSHPPDQDRIASAQAEQAPGVFFSNLPATAIFGHFDAISRGVTEDLYRSIFGPDFQSTAMHATDGLLARSEKEQVRSEARDRFFAGAFTPLRAIRFPSLYEAQQASGNYWKEELVAARNTMQQLAPACREAIKQLDAADDRLVEILQAKSLQSCNVRIQIESLRKFGGDASMLQARQQVTFLTGKIGNQLQPFEEAAGKRLRANLFLLQNPAIAARVPNAAELFAEGKRLAELANQIANFHSSLFELRNTNAVMSVLWHHVEGNRRNDALIREIIDYSNRMHRQLLELRAQFSNVNYPFDHAEGQMTVSQFLMRTIPPSDELGQIYEAADSLGPKLLELNTKLLGRLCTLAETVEAVFKLPPLEGAPA